MASETETLALHLVNALYRVTDGRPNQWHMLAGFDDVTNDAIEFAEARGWMIVERGHSVALTEMGRRLVEESD